MAETRTTRLGLPQWSAGSDGPSRSDFNEAFTALESRAAIDRLTPDTALPNSGVVSAEYYQRTASPPGGGILRSLYRGDSGGVLRALNWIPETLRVRPADTVASTAEGLRVDHPDIAVAGLSITWGGRATLRDSLILGDSADTALGRLQIGGADTLTAGVRARIAGYGAERVLELRAGNPAVTELLRAVDSAGSNVLSISGSGSLTSTQAAAFGAASPGAASLTGAPQPTGDQAAGLLAYGLEAAPTRAALQVNRYGPGSGDPGAILSVLPGSITVGRTGAWSGGSLTLGAPTISARADRLAWYPTADDMTEGSGYDGAGFSSTQGVWSTFGAELANSGAPSGAASTLRSWPSSASTWTGYLLRAYQVETAGSTEVARLDAVGRLTLNAPWRGSGNRPAELRDARQYVAHYSNRIWVQPGTYEGSGLLVVGGGAAVVYTWPVMTVRSASATQLEISCRLESQYFRNYSSSDTPLERQTMQMQWDISTPSLNGGAWTGVTQNQISNDLLSVQEQIALVSANYEDASGNQDNFTIPVLTTLPAGATFQLRFRVQAATGSNVSDAIPPAWVRLRRADLYVREVIIQTYAAT